MATDDLLTLPAKQHATLFLVSWHNTVVRYTDWTEDVISGGQTYTSEPRIGINLPRESGGVQEQPAKLTWPITIAPADTLTAQSVHAQVAVLVTELIPGDDTTLATRYFGWVKRAAAGRRGDRNIASLRLESIKARFRSPLGIPAMRTCGWRFGDQNCQKVVVPDLQETGTIATLTDDVATITGLTTTATPDYWLPGYLEVNGERVGIRRYDMPNVFYLRRRPPVSWVGQSVLATPGCVKTPMECNGTWDNLQHFTALGFKMPPRHPIIELPSIRFQSISPNLSALLQIPGITALYDVYEGVHKTNGGPTPTGLPLSQAKFRESDDTGWNSNNMPGSADWRVGWWFDTSVVDPLLRKNLSQLQSVALRPHFVRGGVVGGDGFVSQGVDLCGALWDFGPTDDYGGARWALRGWKDKVGLDEVCSSDFRWVKAYTIGEREAGFNSTLGRLDMIFSNSNSHLLAETGQSAPYTYHDNVGGLTFLAVCRNRCVQFAFFLRSPTEVNIVTAAETADSLVFESVGSWALSMGGAVVINGESGSPTQFTADGALDLVDPTGSPPGINWRVYGLRVTPGGQMETLTSSATLPYAIIDSAAAPNVMAPATGYRAIRGQLECSAMVMYDRPLSDADLGTAIQYLEGRFAVFHPPI